MNAIRLWGLDEEARRLFWQAFVARAEVPQAERDDHGLPTALLSCRWAPWWWALLTESYDYPVRTGLGLVLMIMVGIDRWLGFLWR